MPGGMKEKVSGFKERLAVSNHQLAPTLEKHRSLLPTLVTTFNPISKELLRETNPARLIQTNRGLSCEYLFQQQ